MRKLFVLFALLLFSQAGFADTVSWENTKTISGANGKLSLTAPKEFNTCKIYSDTYDGWDDCMAYVLVNNSFKNFGSSQLTHYLNWLFPNTKDTMYLYSKNFVVETSNITQVLNETINQTILKTGLTATNFLVSPLDLNAGESMIVKILFKRQRWTLARFDLTANIGGNLITLDPDVSACGTLSTANSVYTLTNNINSSGTCLTVGANNITIDGAGYMITYSQSAGGYGIYNTGGYDIITIQNLIIIQANSTITSSHGILTNGMINSMIRNNNISTTGADSQGISLRSSSNSNTLSNNTIFVSGVLAVGIELVSSTNNNVVNGSIKSQQRYAYYLETSGVTNKFTNTGFTTDKFNLFEITNRFNYNNQTNGSIWLNTSSSIINSVFTRTLITWSNTSMIWNDTASAALTATYNLTGLLPSQSYTVMNGSTSQVIATDAAGALSVNIGLASGVKTTIQINTTAAGGGDTTPPTVSIQLPANTTYDSVSRTLNYTASDETALSQCKYELNGAANVSLNGCANTTFTAATGGNTLRVYANDTSNNWGSATTYFTITLADNTLPSITIQSPANTTYNISVIDINFTVSDNVGVSKCFYELNGAANVSITNCLNTTISPSDGSKWIKLWANDTSNNWNSTPLVYFVKDTTPPNITLVNLSSNITNDNTPTFTGNTTDALSTVTSVGYRLNGGSWQAATATDGAFNSLFENYTITTSQLADDNWLIEVRSWDALGNIVTSYPSFNFTVDTIPPSINLQLPANTTYNSTSRTLNYTTYDLNGLSSCKYELNGAANVSLNGCANTTFTAATGGNTLRVYANDTINNLNSSTVSFIITIPDTTPPSITLITPINTTYTSTSISLTYTTSDNQGISQCKYELNGANTSLPTCANTTITAVEGSNNIKVWVNDTSNNWNVSSRIYFSVNTTIETPTSNYNPVILLGKLYLLFRDTVNFNSNKLIGISDITLSGGVYYGGIGEVPACDSSKRGLVQFIQNSGVDDSLSICMRNSTGSYLWRNATLN